MYIILLLINKLYNSYINISYAYMNTITFLYTNSLSISYLVFTS